MSSPADPLAPCEHTPEIYPGTRVYADGASPCWNCLLKRAVALSEECRRWELRWNDESSPITGLVARLDKAEAALATRTVELSAVQGKLDESLNVRDSLEDEVVRLREERNATTTERVNLAVELEHVREERDKARAALAEVPAGGVSDG